MRAHPPVARWLRAGERSLSRKLVLTAPYIHFHFLVRGDAKMNVSVDETLFSKICINYGPAGLLGRALLKAEAAARARGVTLSFASMQDLMLINEANRESWGPVFPG